MPHRFAVLLLGFVLFAGLLYWTSLEDSPAAAEPPIAAEPPRVLEPPRMLDSPLAPAAGPPLAPKPPREALRYEAVQVHMGVKWKIVFYATDDTKAAMAGLAVFARIAQLDRVMSDYKPESELSQLSATAGTGVDVPLSDDLWQVLSAADQLSRASQGAFDVTVGPAVLLWRTARRERKLPTEDQLAAARAAIGYQHLILDPEKRTARLTVSGMRLDLGGSGRGYAADEALKIFAAHGIEQAMIDCGGDVAVSAPPPGREAWLLAVVPLADKHAEPDAYLTLAHAAATTSGDAFQFVEIDGRRYSHIVDPRTAIGVDGPAAVTVVARRCIDADSLATAASVLGPQAGLALIERSEDAAARFVGIEDQQRRSWESKRWAKWLEKATETAPQEAAEQAPQAENTAPKAD